MRLLVDRLGTRTERERSNQVRQLLNYPSEPDQFSIGQPENVTRTESVRSFSANPRFSVAGIPQKTRLKIFLVFVIALISLLIYLHRVNSTLAATEATARVALIQAEAAKSQLRQAEITHLKELQQIQDRLAVALSSRSAYQQQKEIRHTRDELAASIADQVAVLGHEPATRKSSLSIAATPRQCRADNLSLCSNDDLLTLGSVLQHRMKLILDEFQEATSGMERGTPGWYKAFDAAEVRASKEFRECCAEDALKYHKEVAARLGPGHEDAALYDWTQKILQPLDSNDYIEAAHDTKAIQFYYDLTVMQAELK